MENSVCLDSDFLIDVLRGKDYALKWVQENEDNCLLATTVINIFEVYSGIYKAQNLSKNLEALQKLLSGMSILNFEDKDAIEAARINSLLEKEGKVIDTKDLFIGAITIKNGFSLKTNNKSHFSRIKGLALV